MAREQSVIKLFQSVRSIINRSIARHPDGSMFHQIPPLLHSVQVDPLRATPLSTPVVERWLQQSIDSAPELWRTHSKLIGEATPFLPWTETQKDMISTPENQAYRSNYSICCFAGLDPQKQSHRPPIFTTEFPLWFTLLAPNTYYPRHNHLPPEMYGILSGTSEWQKGDVWSTHKPGDIIVHHPFESHAKQTKSEPVLTWVFWPYGPESTVHLSVKTDWSELQRRKHLYER